MSSPTTELLNKAPSLRPGFTPAQELQAEYIGHISSSERARRIRLPTFPIDNVTRDVVADRDDGVFVEAQPSGEGYRVHVTIADVAAHVRAHSPLATAAWQRATTEYWPGRTDPMFPRELEERLSLEHNKERLGLTISITLDKHFQPMHTQFTPVITHPDNTSYAEVPERMREDPQFQMMDRIAGGIRAEYFGKNNAAWRELVELKDRIYISAQEMEAQEMVATYMLLANHAAAEFMSEAGLPFIYRNFDGAMGDTNAYYSTDLERHTALEKAGLKGGYAHVTSPIRRAPDYFNALMMHYAQEVLAALQAQLVSAYPAVTQDALQQALWQRGPALLKILVTPDTQHMAVRKKQLMDLCLHTLGEVGISTSKHKLWPSLQHLMLPPLPYGKHELEQFSRHINEVNRSPHMRELAKLNDRHESNMEQMYRVANQSAEALAAINENKFSSILSAAAQTGAMPRHLFDETKARLRHGRLEETQDYFSIFVVAQSPRNNRWLALKREVAKRVKHDPSLVNALVDKLALHIAPATLDEGKPKPARTGELTENGEDSAQIMQALVTMHADAEIFAPEFYSVGHDGRAALSHAKYAFLESYAFGQLQPLAQVRVPNLWYAELEIEGTNRYELLSRMVAEAGAKMVVEQHSTPTGNGIYVKVEGGEFSAPIEVDAIAEDPSDAMRAALRRLLRNTGFKSVVSQQPQSGRDAMNPHEYLKAMVEQHGGNLEIHVPTRANRGAAQHQAEVKVTLNGKTYSHKATEPNIHRAERIASVKMLRELNWEIPASEEPAKSWVSDAQEPTRGQERQIFSDANRGGGR